MVAPDLSQTGFRADAEGLMALVTRSVARNWILTRRALGATWQGSVVRIGLSAAYFLACITIDSTVRDKLGGG